MNDLHYLAVLQILNCLPAVRTKVIINIDKRAESVMMLSQSINAVVMNYDFNTTRTCIKY